MQLPMFYLLLNGLATLVAMLLVTKQPVSVSIVQKGHWRVLVLPLLMALLFFLTLLLNSAAALWAAMLLAVFYLYDCVRTPENLLGYVKRLNPFLILMLFLSTVASGWVFNYVRLAPPDASPGRTEMILMFIASVYFLALAKGGLLAIMAWLLKQKGYHKGWSVPLLLLSMMGLMIVLMLPAKKNTVQVEDGEGEPACHAFLSSVL